jgi:hypothetical protein
MSAHTAKREGQGRGYASDEESREHEASPVHPGNLYRGGMAVCASILSPEDSCSGVRKYH